MARDRHDGSLVRDLPPYRRMLPFLMRRRNESAVYFEQRVDVSATLAWIEEVAHTRGVRVTLFHVILGALVRTLHARPRLNRFVAGRRLYQRHGISVSFAVKKRMDDDTPINTIKLELDPAATLFELVERLRAEVTSARGDRPTAVDRELALFLRLPAPLLSGIVRLFWWLDGLGLAPRALTAPDPMFASAFVSHLGSVGIDAAYHHLYEHGNCPVFVTIGTVERHPVPGADGTVDWRPHLRLKYVYDERVEDGFYCARALELLGALVADPAAWADTRPDAA